MSLKMYFNRVFSIFLLLTLSGISISNAQIGIPATPPPGSQALTNAEQIRLRSEVRHQVRQSFYQPFLEMTAEQFRIGYFVSEVANTAPAGFISSQRLLEIMPSLEIVTSMDALSGDRDATTPAFDAVLVDVSALDWLPSQALWDLYASGVTVRTVGMTFEQHQSTTGDFCTSPGHGDPANRSQFISRSSTTTVIVTYFQIHDWQDHTLDQRATSLDYGLRQCKENRMTLGYSAGFWMVDIGSSKDVDSLAPSLLAAAQSYAIYRHRGELETLVAEQFRVSGGEDQ